MTTSKEIISTDFPRAKTHKEIWEAYDVPMDLEGCVKLFFEILDTYEESDSGREFRPTTIGSVRVWDAHRLSVLLPRMRNLLNIPQPKVLNRD